MNYRQADIMAAKSISGASEEPIDLDFTDILSRLVIRWHRTASKNGMDAPSPADITKIEIVDGGDTIVSMTGYEAQALAMYNRNVPTMVYGQRLNGNSMVDFFPIDFGRYLYDRELAFDPSKFTNPQLKITYDVDVADTGVTSGTLEVKGYFFEDRKVSPIGMLAPIEHYSNALGADGTYDYVKLPTDQLIRRMNVRLFTSGYEPWYTADEVALYEQTRKKTVFNWDVETLYRYMHGEYPPIEEFIVGLDTGSGTTFYVCCSDYWGVPQLVAQSGAYVVYENGATACRGGTLVATGEGSTQFAGTVRGYLPWHTLDFKMGDLNDMADWYDPSGKGVVELRVKSHTSGTSGAVNVTLEQLRRY